MGAGQALQQQVEAKVNEIKELASGLSEEAASKSPADGEWCAKEVLSHLIGPELGAWKGWIEVVINEETPVIDLSPGVSYFEGRGDKPVSELLATFESEYKALGESFAGLSDDQLNRKAHTPAFKDTPLGEYPTLAQFSGGIINFHMADHVQQLRSLCQ